MDDRVVNDSIHEERAFFTLPGSPQHDIARWAMVTVPEMGTKLQREGCAVQADRQLCKFSQRHLRLSCGLVPARRLIVAAKNRIEHRPRKKGRQRVGELRESTERLSELLDVEIL